MIGALVRSSQRVPPYLGEITMMFRGREVIRMDRGRVVLDRFVEALKDVAVVEQPAKVEGRNMTMILAPKH